MTRAVSATGARTDRATATPSRSWGCSIETSEVGAPTADDAIGIVIVIVIGTGTGIEVDVSSPSAARSRPLCSSVAPAAAERPVGWMGDRGADTTGPYAGWACTGSPSDGRSPCSR